MIRIITILLACQALLWAGRVEVVLESAAELPAGRVHLGDIAEISGDSSLVARLRILEVGRVESAGRQTRVSANALKSFYFPAICPAESVTVSGATIVKVTARFREIDGDSLRSLVLQAIEPRMAGVPKGDYVVEAPKFPDHIRVPEDSFRWNVEIPERFDGRGDELVSVQVIVDGKVQTSYSLPVLVRRWSAVAQTVEPIQRGQPVQAQQVKINRMETTRQNREFVTRLEDVIGRSSLRSIGRDQFLVDNWFEKPFAVHAGEQVRLHVQVGGADLSVLGMARVNGYVGQRIEVENTQSHKRLQGFVQAPGEVSVID